MPDPLRVLILEDNPSDVELIVHELQRAGFALDWQQVETKEEYQAQLHSRLDVILSDYNLPQFDALEALHELRERGWDIPFIVVSGAIGEEMAVECMKQGVDDYLLKDRLARLGPAVAHVLREKQLREEKRRAENTLARYRRDLQRLSAQVIKVQELERQRIARELHDELGQNLAALKMDLAWLHRKVAEHHLKGNVAQALGKIESMLQLVDTTVQVVHGIVSRLRPSVLDSLGLSAALEWEAQTFQERVGIPCVLTLPQEDIPLGSEQSTALFRIFQEILTNVMRHAQATLVTASLKKDGGFLVLQVQDNGRGITSQELSSSQSLGILGMRERALTFGGEVHIRGIPGEGTVVMARIPLSGHSEEPS